MSAQKITLEITPKVWPGKMLRLRLAESTLHAIDPATGSEVLVADGAPTGVDELRWVGGTLYYASSSRIEGVLSAANAAGNNDGKSVTISGSGWGGASTGAMPANGAERAVVVIPGCPAAWEGGLYDSTTDSTEPGWDAIRVINAGGDLAPGDDLVLWVA